MPNSVDVSPMKKIIIMIFTKVVNIILSAILPVSPHRKGHDPSVEQTGILIHLKKGISFFVSD